MSPPALLTAWQLVQFRSLRRKTASPRAGSPLAATSETREDSSAAVKGLMSVEIPAALPSAATSAGSAWLCEYTARRATLAASGGIVRRPIAAARAAPPPWWLRNADTSATRSTPSAAAAGMSSAARVAAAATSSRTSAATAAIRKGIRDPVPASSSIADRPARPPIAARASIAASRTGAPTIGERAIARIGDEAASSFHAPASRIAGPWRFDPFSDEAPPMSAISRSRSFSGFSPRVVAASASASSTRDRTASGKPPPRARL